VVTLRPIDESNRDAVEALDVSPLGRAAGRAKAARSASTSGTASSGPVTSSLPEAVRLLVFKTESAVVVHDDSGG
jgi:hypothetical protein